ncbi:RidA family protein [Paraglaciecola aestuariivivens]
MKLLVNCLIIVVSQAMFSTQLLSAEPVKFLNIPGESSDLPFSKATQVGNLLFLSGELGIDPKTNKLVSGGIQAESHQLMQNISNTLKHFGSDLSKVAKCTVFLADIKEWPQFNQVYVTFFTKPYPARSALAASGLALSARVEVECIASI